jgi:hypothetical protein
MERKEEEDGTRTPRQKRDVGRLDAARPELELGKVPQQCLPCSAGASCAVGHKSLFQCVSPLKR